MKNNEFLKGFRDGIPIGLGYFAVSFSLGFIAGKSGLTVLQAIISSFLNHASAGEYALYTSIENKLAYVEIALITFIVNIRYLLMSTAMSQLLNPSEKMINRVFVGFGITDEIFGICCARKGFLVPSYAYGAMTASFPLWCLGNGLGVAAGNLLPLRLVSAFSVALYGMFLAIIIPSAKKQKSVLVAVILSFIFSYVMSVVQITKKLSYGARTVIITIVVSVIISMIFPVEDKSNEEGVQNEI